MKRTAILRSATAGLLVALTTQIVVAMPANLPPVEYQGNVAFLSGGIGLDESTAIKGVMQNYPLVLEFAGKGNRGNEYLSDVPVQVSDMQGHVLLTTTARGPFLLASLPNGHYSVSVRYDGKTQRRDVTLTSSAHVHALFLWPM